MSILSIKFHVAVYFISGTTTLAETLVVTLERQHTGWFLIVCRLGVAVGIIYMLNQDHILLVLFLPLKDTMVRDMFALILIILLEMRQLLRLISMIRVTTLLISQLQLIHIVGLLLCMRWVANLPLLAGIIRDMDIKPL